MTQAAQDATRFASRRRDEWTAQQINAELADLNAALANVRSHPDAADHLAALIARTAARIEALEATR